MPPTIYIHLGQHKTGTTSVQKFCRRWREELKTQLGLYYPLPVTPPYHRHHDLFPFKKEQWERIRRDMSESGCTRLFISNEELYPRGVKDSDLAALRECFPGATIVFLLYLRRLDDYCKSLYNERLKNGRLRQPGYSASWNALTRRAAYLHPSRLLGQCERQVGREQLGVRIYDLKLLKNGDIVDDIFDSMGLVPSEAMDKGQRHNLSLPNTALPYVTDSLLSSYRHDPLREELQRKLSLAFSSQDEDETNEALLAGLEKEIELLDARYLPGYKKLFEKRKCDLAFTELNASPKDVLIVDLLYSILFELRRQQQQSIVHRVQRFACVSLPGAARRLVALFRERVTGLIKGWGNKGGSAG